MKQPPSLTATVFVTSLIASAALEPPAWGYAVYVR